MGEVGGGGDKGQCERWVLEVLVGGIRGSVKPKKKVGVGGLGGEGGGGGGVRGSVKGGGGKVDGQVGRRGGCWMSC